MISGRKIEEGERMFEFSIIIPHYKSIDLLEKLILSIPKKKNIQVIVVDDSGQKSEVIKIEEMLFDISRTEVQVILNDGENHGAGIARNIGLKYAKNEYLLFADADDYFVNNAFEMIANVLENNENNDIYLFKPESVILETGEKSLRTERYEKLFEMYEKSMDRYTLLNLKLGFITPWSKVYSRNFINNNDIEFDPLEVSNDVMFTTKAALATNLIYVSQEVIYIATRSAGSLTTKITRERILVRANVEIERVKLINQKLGKKSLQSFYGGYIGLLTLWIRHGLGVVNILNLAMSFESQGIHLIKLNRESIKKNLSRSFIERKRNERKICSRSKSAEK